MSVPLIHVFSASVKDGKVEGFKEYAKEHVEFVQAKAPRLLAFHEFLSEDGRRVSVVQVHPDADHMDFFMQEVVAEHGVQAYEFLEHDERSDAFGALNDATQAAIRQFGVDLRLSPYHLGGFTRLGAQ